MLLMTPGSSALPSLKIIESSEKKRIYEFRTKPGYFNSIEGTDIQVPQEHVREDICQDNEEVWG